MKKDWEIKRLGDICELITKGTTPTSIGFDFQTNGINFVKIESFSEDGTIIENKVAHISQECHEALKRSQLQKGDILFSIAGALGRTTIIDESIIPANTNQALAIIRLQNKDITFIKFLLYYFKTDFILKQIEKDKGGVAQQNLSLKQIGDFEIKIPPLEEQKRIVKILDEKFTQLETIKANAQTNLQNAKDLFQSQLTKAFSNTTWEKKTIGEVCSKRENIKWKNENAGNEYQYIDLSAVDRESKNISDTQIITKENAPSRAQQIVKTGDILFGTTRPTLKRFCLLSDDYDGQICSTGFCVIRPNQNIVSSDWMFYQFYNDEFYKYIEPLQKGANYPAVTDKDIMNYNISVPPLPEQKRIVEELDTLSEKVRHLQEIYTKQITNCEELKQSLLQKAFEGEL